MSSRYPHVAADTRTPTTDTSTSRTMNCLLAIVAAACSAVSSWGDAASATAAQYVVDGGDRGDVRGVSAECGRDHVHRPLPRWRRPPQQWEQRQRRAHQRAAEERARPRLPDATMEQAVPDAEGR